MPMPRAQTEMKGRCAPIANYNLHPARYEGRPGYPQDAVNTGSNTCIGLSGYCLFSSSHYEYSKAFGRKERWDRGAGEVLKELKRPGLNFTQEHRAVLAGSED
jgi:hypothetical protein